MRSRILLVLVFGFAILSGSAVWWWWTSTPTYSLRELGRGFAAHDQLAVEDYLDQDALALSIVDALLAQIGNNAMNSASSGEGLEALGAVFARGLAESMKPTLVAKVKDAMHDAIRSQPVSGIGGALMKVQSDDVVVLSRRDTVSLVHIYLPQDSVFAADSLVLRLTRLGRHWRVIGVDVMPAAFGLDGLPGGSSAGLRAGLSTRRRAGISALKSDLRVLAAVQESYLLDHSTYAASTEEIMRSSPDGYFRMSNRGTVVITGNKEFWTAEATSPIADTTCTMSGGVTDRPDNGVPMC